MREDRMFAAGASVVLMLAGFSVFSVCAGEIPEAEHSLEIAVPGAEEAGVEAEQTAAAVTDGAEAEETETEQDISFAVVREGTDAGGTGWTEREVSFKTMNPEDQGSVILRFYEDMPNVAYISYEVFHETVQPDRPVEVTKESDGVYILTGESARLVADTGKETLSYDDYYAFTDTAGPSEKTKAQVLLDGAPFARYAGVEAEPDAGEITFEFARYGIDLRSDDEGVYIPFTTLSNLYDDASFLYRAVFNTQEIVFSNSTESIWSDAVDPQWYEPVLRMKERPADLAAYSYAQLCFALEHFYGYPGRELIDETIMKEQGLDAALKAYGELGENAARLLQSTDMAEYFAGGERLRLLLWDGDHTNIDFLGQTSALMNSDWLGLNEAVIKLDEELDDGFEELRNELLMKDNGVRSCLYFARDEARRNSLGEGTYFSKGNTAWCVFDEFKLNKTAWDEYYADENRDLDAFLENTENDAVVILLSALKQAQENPEITNFVVDMTQNPGGNDGVAAAVESLLTGETRNPFIDMLTGAHYVTLTQVDRNFDGVFDEKDDEVHYDFHFAILLGEGGYSNGTICPSVLKDNGVLTLGEKTRGGCCCLQCLSTAEGIEFMLSSSTVHHVDRNGDGIDEGVEPEIEMYRYNENGDVIGAQRELILGDEKYHAFIPDYSSFYDIEEVGKRIDEYYAKPRTQADETETSGEGYLAEGDSDAAMQAVG